MRATQSRRALMTLVLVLTGTALADDPDVDWWTVDGGGAGVSKASSGGTYTLAGTIGQPDARNHPEPMTGGAYSMTGGFRVVPECPAIAADYDDDCDVDQADFAFFESCTSGPAVTQGEPACADTMLDADGDVDQSDFAVFQRCLSGANVPANPGCAD